MVMVLVECWSRPGSRHRWRRCRNSPSHSGWSRNRQSWCPQQSGPVVSKLPYVVPAVPEPSAYPPLLATPMTFTKVDCAALCSAVPEVPVPPGVKVILSFPKKFCAAAGALYRTVKPAVVPGAKPDEAVLAFDREPDRSRTVWPSSSRCPACPCRNTWGWQ